MPTYQYRCINCEDQFEEFQSIVEPPVETCSKCKGQVQRVISGGAGFIFKGSGFYQTDYRNSQYKKDAAKDKPEAKVSSSESKSKDTKKTSGTPDSKKK